MKKQMILLAWLCTSVFLPGTSLQAQPQPQSQGEPDKAAETIYKNLMSATESNNYEAFMAESDTGMRAALSKPMLASASAQLSPRMEKGYDSIYLGKLKKADNRVYLWKIGFKDGGDDILATLSVKNAKASGFYLK